MNYEIIAVLIITLIALILFLTEAVRVDVTALLTMTLLMLSGVITPEEGISGFSNPATVTVLALLILSTGLQNTGVVNFIGNYILKFTGNHEWQMILTLMVTIGFISAFINNTAAVAVFLPVAIRIANSTGISVSKLLIPMSVAAMLGGTCTLVGTSTNLLVSSISKSFGLGSFSMFEFSQLGLIFLVTGILYMIFLGRFLIPLRRKPQKIADDYGLKEYLTELIINPESPFIGKSLKETGLGEKYNIDVLEIIRNESIKFYPDHLRSLREGDILLVKGEIGQLLEASSTVGISIKADVNFYEQWLKNEDLTLTEAIVSAESFLRNKTIRSARFRHRYNANAIAIRRNGETIKKKLRDIELEFGDSILIASTKDNLEAIDASKDFILLNEVDEENFSKKKMVLASSIMVTVIVLASLEIVPIVIGSVAGCVTMFITRCISPRKAYKEMDWQIFFLLAGIIPLGLAIEKSGAANYLASGLLEITGNTKPIFIVALLYLTTTLITEILSNNAAAVLLGPIAVNIAQILDIAPKALLFTIMFAASTSFLTPIGYQTNTMIYGPGKYKYTDYFRVGIILNLILWLLSSFAITAYWID
jgi:di/tricarboxylate transporter